MTPPARRNHDATDAAAEIERLHAVLDHQPSCLLRVDFDGTLLAVNDAALNLLAAQRLVDVLDTNIRVHLHGDTADAFWLDFVDRVSKARSASAEWELVDLSGARRAVALQAVAQFDHPDGRPSLLITVRDVSAARRLEESLHEHEHLRDALHATIAGRDEIAAA
jgi:PAS domain-containing protein